MLKTITINEEEVIKELEFEHSIACELNWRTSDPFSILGTEIPCPEPADFIAFVNRCCDQAPTSLFICRVCLDWVTPQPFLYFLCCRTTIKPAIHVFSRIEPIK